MRHHYFLFIGYSFEMNDGRDGQGCSVIQAQFNAQTGYELKKEIDIVIEESIAYRKQKFDLKTFHILCCSTIFSWIEGQRLDRARTHHFVIFTRGVYSKDNSKMLNDHMTLNFSLKVTNDEDLQIQFGDAIEDINNQQKISLGCEMYSIINLNVINHRIEESYSIS